MREDGVQIVGEGQIVFAEKAPCRRHVGLDAADDFQAFMAARCLDEIATPAAEADDCAVDHWETSVESGCCRIASIIAELSLSGPAIAIAVRSKSACASVTGGRRPCRTASARVRS